MFAPEGLLGYPEVRKPEGVPMLRKFALVMAVLGLAACTNPNDLDEELADLGDFHLGHNVVVAPNLTKGPASRTATEEEWVEAMKAAIDERFSRYDGSRLYHLGVSVEGYVLAIPGVPLVASPKSALILHVTVWDDAEQKKLNEEPYQVTVVESISGKTVLGSGLTQSKQIQLKNLSRNAAKLIENWMVQQNFEHHWFGGPGKMTDRTPKLNDTEGDAEIVEDGAEESTDGESASDTDDDAAAAAVAATTVIMEPEVSLDE